MLRATKDLCLCKKLPSYEQIFNTDSYFFTY